MEENKNNNQKNQNKEIKREQIIIDASNGILGRIASFAAKKSLLGKEIVIVNCDNALLTGGRGMIIEEYGIARRRGGKSLNGPFFPKHSERIMKRTIRGMLSHGQQRGLDALKRVMCYPNVPKEYESSSKITVVKNIRSKTTLLSDVSKVM